MREVRGRRGLATAPHVRGLHDGAVSGDVSNGKLLRPRSKGSAQSRPSTESPSALARPTRRHVLVVDSDHDFCSGLTTLLEASGMRATAVSDGHAGLSGARRLRPHLVVVEVMLPDLCGYEVCHQLRAEFGSELPIILVSGKRTEPCDRVAGLLIGADDYVVKPAALDELLTRIRALLSRARNNGRAGLTPRELEVLELLAEGLDQAEIASYLFISPKTVATHIDHILAKLGARSRAEAVARAYRERLVTA